MEMKKPHKGRVPKRILCVLALLAILAFAAGLPQTASAAEMTAGGVLTYVTDDTGVAITACDRTAGEEAVAAALDEIAAAYTIRTVDSLAFVLETAV
jgi:hypothetical protein